MQTQQATWPAGVIARHLTAGGATVVVWEADEWSPIQAICSGCNKSSRDGGPDSSAPGKWAQAHAEKCRVLPKPEVQR